MDVVYQAIGWITDDVELQLEILSTKLRNKFPAASIQQNARRISLTIGEWKASVNFNDELYVADEAQEFSRLFPNNLRSNEISVCRRRLEIFCADDLTITHFNNYLLVLEACENEGVVLVDASTGELI
jgi:hypothetical protein